MYSGLLLRSPCRLNELAGRDTPAGTWWIEDSMEAQSLERPEQRFCWVITEWQCGDLLVGCELELLTAWDEIMLI